MNRPIPPSTAPAETITTSTLLQEITPPAPPAEKKREPLTCKKQDEYISNLRDRPNDGTENSAARLLGDLIFLGKIVSSDCPTP